MGICVFTVQGLRVPSIQELRVLGCLGCLELRVSGFKVYTLGSPTC